MSSASPRPQDRFFRPSQQLILRLKDAAAVGPIAVEGQVDFQAVGQKLHGTRELLSSVAERPEHGGGVSAQGHGVTDRRLKGMGSGRVLKRVSAQRGCGLGHAGASLRGDAHFLAFF